MADPKMDSLQQRLRANLERKQARTTERFSVPGYKGDGVDLKFELSAHVAYAETRKSVRGSMQLDEAEQELKIAADTLASAYKDVWAEADGELEPLGLSLQALASYLGLAGAENDTQALFLIIPDELDLIQLHAGYMVWKKGAASAAEQELVGEYVATSS